MLTLNFNNQDARVLSALHEHITNAPKAGLVSLYRDEQQPNSHQVLIIVYARSKQFLGLIPNDSQGNKHSLSGALMHRLYHIYGIYLFSIFPRAE